MKIKREVSLEKVVMFTLVIALVLTGFSFLASAKSDHSNQGFSKNDRSRLTRISENTKYQFQFHGTEYTSGQLAKVWLFLLEDGQPIINSSCSINIYYPNSTLMVKNEVMSPTVEQNGIFYYDLTAPETKGVYMTYAKCLLPQNTYVNNFVSSNKTESLTNLTVENQTLQFLETYNQTLTPNNFDTPQIIHFRNGNLTLNYSDSFKKFRFSIKTIKNENTPLYILDNDTRERLATINVSTDSYYFEFNQTVDSLFLTSYGEDTSISIKNATGLITKKYYTGQFISEEIELEGDVWNEFSFDLASNGASVDYQILDSNYSVLCHNQTDIYNCSYTESLVHVRFLFERTNLSDEPQLDRYYLKWSTDIIKELRSSGELHISEAKTDIETIKTEVWKTFYKLGTPEITSLDSAQELSGAGLVSASEGTSTQTCLDNQTLQISQQVVFCEDSSCQTFVVNKTKQCSDRCSDGKCITPPTMKYIITSLIFVILMAIGYWIYTR